MHGLFVRWILYLHMCIHGQEQSLRNAAGWCRGGWMCGRSVMALAMCYAPQAKLQMTHQSCVPSSNQ